MEAVWFVSEFLAAAFENFIMVYFLTAFLGPRRTVGMYIPLLGCTALLTGLSWLTSVYFLYNGIFAFIPIMVLFLYSVLLLNGTWKKKLILCLFIVLALMLVAALTSFVSWIFSSLTAEEVLNNRGWERIVAIWLSKVVLFSLFQFILRKKNRTYKFKAQDVLTLITAPVVLMISGISINIGWTIFPENFTTKVLLTVPMVGLVITVFIFYFMVRKISQENKLQMELALARQKEETLAKNTEEIMTAYGKARTLRHDLKNRSTAVLALLKAGQIAEAIEQIEAELDYQRNQKGIVVTRNPAINAICDIKLTKLQSTGVEIRTSIEAEPHGIDELDLAVILGNLLDNVFEYYQTKPDMSNKRVSIKMRQVNENVAIVIENTIDRPIIEGNPCLHTTKENKTLHGMGINSVREHLQKYSGSLVIKEEDNVFSANCVFPQ